MHEYPLYLEVRLPPPRPSTTAMSSIVPLIHTYKSILHDHLNKLRYIDVSYIYYASALPKPHRFYDAVSEFRKGCARNRARIPFLLLVSHTVLLD